MMLYQEYELYDSVYNIYQTFVKGKLKPRSSCWLIYKKKRKQLYTFITTGLKNDYSEEKVLQVWDDFGKNRGYYQFFVQVARATGIDCPLMEIAGGRCCSEKIALEARPSAKSRKKIISNYMIVCKNHSSR